MKTANEKPANLKVGVELITPELAQELLGSNVQRQRGVASRNLAKLEADMLNDRFLTSGESIIISNKGRLLDGQHRLLASVNTKMAFWTVVVRGIDEEAFRVINVGKSRSCSDVLKIAGENNTILLSTTINRIVEYLRDASTIGSGNETVSTAEAMDTLAMCPRLRTAVTTFGSFHKQDVISGSRIAWLYYLAYEEAPAAAPKFFAQLRDGDMLPKDSPIYLFRSRLMADRAATAKLPTREVLALLIKTWNAYIQNEKIKVLRWYATEPFPQLIFPKAGK